YKGILSHLFTTTSLKFFSVNQYNGKENSSISCSAKGYAPSSALHVFMVCEDEFSMPFFGWWPIMWRKLSIILALLFIGYTAAGFLILPVFLRSLAQHQLTEALRREVTIRDIDLNPFILSVRVKELKISENRDEAPVASFDELFVNLQI